MCLIYECRRRQRLKTLLIRMFIYVFIYTVSHTYKMTQMTGRRAAECWWPGVGIPHHWANDKLAHNHPNRVGYQIDVFLVCPKLLLLPVLLLLIQLLLQPAYPSPRSRVAMGKP